MQFLKHYTLVLLFALFVIGCGGKNGSDSAVVVKDNSKPVISVNTTLSINETDLIVTTVRASDEDKDALDFSLSGSDKDYFTINKKTGVLQLKNYLDYENDKHTYNITLSVSDSKDTVSIDLVINLQDVYDEVPILDNSTFTLNENVAIGTVVGNVNVLSSGDSVISAFTLQNNNFFEVNASGVIKTKIQINYEEEDNHSLSIVASNQAGQSATKIITISINDINESGLPTNITLSSNSVNENDTLTVGTFTSDGNGTSFDFSLVNGAGDTDNNLFEINTSTDQLKLKNYANYELQSSYSIRVEVEDNGNNKHDQNFTIYVNDLNDIAIFTTSPAVSILQDSNFDYDAQAIDEDAGHTLTILTHTIPAGFEVDSSDGNNTNEVNISVQDIGALGDNMVGSHNFTLNVRENNTSNTISQNFTLVVQDVNDEPTYDGNTSDKSIDYGGNNVFSFTLNDGDQNASQNINVTASSSHENIATVSINKSSFVDNEILEVTVIGVDVGESNISVNLLDDESNTISGDDNNSFSFKVSVRANGIKVYNDRKESNNNTEHNIIFDGIIYGWDTTNKWYHTSNTVLMPVGQLDSNAYIGENFVYIKDGHYIVNKVNYLWDERKSTQYDGSSDFSNVNGDINMSASLYNAQHDKSHNIFVSRLLGSSDVIPNTPANYFYLTDIVEENDINKTSVPNGNDEIWGSDINNSLYASNSLLIDENNDGSINDLCANIYGQGWRIPTSYELGTSAEILADDREYLGYVPAYMGEETSTSVISSTVLTISSTNYLWKIRTSDSRSRLHESTVESNVRCVYY